MKLETLKTVYGWLEADGVRSSLTERVADDIFAMETPITADRLAEDGWVTAFKSSAASVFVNLAVGELVEVSVGDGCVRTFINDGSTETSRELSSITTMYDLRELVRLLGGAK